MAVHGIAKGKRITGETRQQLGAWLKRHYEKGASIRLLARATGRSYGFVHGMLLEAGVTLRARGAQRREAGGS